LIDIIERGSHVRNFLPQYRDFLEQNFAVVWHWRWPPINLKSGATVSCKDHARWRASSAPAGAASALFFVSRPPLRTRGVLWKSTVH
jgi:hypothetical protein